MLRAFKAGNDMVLMIGFAEFHVGCCIVVLHPR